jgi:hypothetical protein
MSKTLTFKVTLKFDDSIQYPEKVADQVLNALCSWLDGSAEGLAAGSDNETFTTSILVEGKGKEKPIIRSWKLS